MSDRRFTFFESYRDVAQLMSDAERLAFYDALVGYGVCGEEPDDLEGAPLVAFTMARPSLDKSARRARANARNAKRKTQTPDEPDESPSEQERREDETEPDGTKGTNPASDGSELEANASEPEANASETERTDTHDDDSLEFAFSDIDIDIDIDEDKDEDKDDDIDEDEDIRGGGSAEPTPQAKPKRPKRPTWTDWWGRWREVSEERGVPPSEYDAQKAFAYYEANGWRQNNGNPIKRWRGALSTCFLNAHPELRKTGGGGDSDVYSRYD